MATVDEFGNIRGSIGDFVFYTLNGKKVVRKKSGFNKNAYTENPNYVKVRQNSSEFGHCSKVGKLIRNELNTFIKGCGDKYLYQTFAKLMTEIKDCDVISERGQRTVKNGLGTEQGKQLLRNFKFGTIDNSSQVGKFQPGLFETLFCLQKPLQKVELNFCILSIDYTDVTCKTRIITKEVSDKTSEIILEEDFSNDEDLHFLAVKKGDDLIHLGFI